jgi:hypothetical protein
MSYLFDAVHIEKETPEGLSGHRVPMKSVFCTRHRPQRRLWRPTLARQVDEHDTSRPFQDISRAHVASLNTFFCMLVPIGLYRLLAESVR